MGVGMSQLLVGLEYFLLQLPFCNLFRSPRLPKETVASFLKVLEGLHPISIYAQQLRTFHFALGLRKVCLCFSSLYYAKMTISDS